MYPILQEEIARVARREMAMRAERNAADERMRATYPTTADPGAIRQTVARSLVRAALALVGENRTISLVAIEERETSTC